jgi:hypothetical protein
MILGPNGKPYPRRRRQTTDGSLAIKDYTRRGYMGLVEIKGIWDEPGHENHGKVVEFHRQNTITYDARPAMARAIAGDDAGHITTVAWGTGYDGTNGPDREDTALANQVITSAVIQPVTYPDDNQSVIFSSQLVRGVGSNYTYNEVGLVTQGGLLFARFAFPGQFKFPQLRLSVNWQIIFI